MSHSEIILYSVKDLQRIFSTSRSSVYRLVGQGGFPASVVVGPADKRGAAVRWRSDEIQAYIDTLPREKVLDV
ncbi:Helix-turn-helix domain containing protein [uncultured Caudovirales phage]|uniref:Helix-turn-helix domain containing protein n=1 Tax=uncultured Caudovirales phage TaxID=2100421 RepID=A0A6J5REM7_9CAUD|nr:Helix-turn-helix domain containing protein [uncultured Caudovirales phage]